MSNETSRERIVAVTGAAGGIGSAICRRLAGPGIRMVLHTRASEDRLAALTEEVEAAGSTVERVVGDLTEGDTAARIIAAAKDRFGGLDYLVSNAGFPNRDPIGRLAADDLRHSLDAMVTAFLRLSTEAMPLLEKSESGRVVAVTGLAAHSFKLGTLSFPATAAAKAGVEALARSLAARMSREGVTVNCVVPGFIRTQSGLYGDDDQHGRRYAAQIVPLGRLGMPEEVAAAVVFLLSDEAGYITGQLLHVNGGLDL